MLRRRFLKSAAVLGASLTAGPRSIDLAEAQQPIRIGAVPGPFVVRMAGYSPSTTSFSRGLALIGEQLVAKFSDAVDVRQPLNVMEAGFGGSDLSWLVDSGFFSLAYVTLREPVAELELAALPFLFGDTASARAAMDGPLGEAAARRIEATLNVRLLGFFENGFRHISNNVRPVRMPADLRGLRIRVLPTQIRTFELLGAEPAALLLPAALEAIKSGTVDGQENPFANTVTYGLHTMQRFHTATYHSYLSRAIIVHRPTYESWPRELQLEMDAAVKAAVTLQRRLKDEEEEQAASTIRAAGGEIIELTALERAAFVDAVAPIYEEARNIYSSEQLALVGR
jgi:TRAP-type C4-dicarboxylate transport system substrate-binding protein